ncbi:hypothetical protein L2E82_46059 [Cichorium intybus]|uniref:Uncharacterized protein n=1 Tax=Cichorium intybus TaxID=13427 RepID=A0ACB8YU43_CICIN|nr:hypothetical protein L2E82_46059 [Cichorium intybus]
MESLPSIGVGGGVRETDADEKEKTELDFEDEGDFDADEKESLPSIGVGGRILKTNSPKMVVVVFVITARVGAGGGVRERLLPFAYLRYF